MKKFLIAVVAASLFAGLGLVGSASAQGPGYHRHGHHHCYPSAGYRYGGGYGYGGYGYSAYPRVVPYGAGYSGGWQPYANVPYRGVVVQQPRFGLYLGF
jgi:hypothetical protein